MHGKKNRSKILFVRLDKRIFDSAISAIIPKPVARHHNILPLFKVFDVLTVAAGDIPDASVIKELERISGCEIEVVLATEDVIRKHIESSYGVGRRASDSK